MNRFLLLILLVSSSLVGFAQQKYWIEAPLDTRGWMASPGCTGIRITPEMLENLPRPALSDRAIRRRERQGISWRQTDFSFRSPEFEAKLKKLGYTIHGYSRWLNSYSITLPVEGFDLNELKALYADDPFHKVELIPVRTLQRMEAPQTSPDLDEVSMCAAAPANGHWYDYGGAWNQTQMVHGEVLHDSAYDGTGMIIAVIDGSFFRANQLGALSDVFHDGRVVATYDFVNGDTNAFRATGSHGTMVLSIMASEDEGRMVGSAPRASYALLRSENEASESKVEEDNWIMAMEFADSIGADVINSSLGYTTFDSDPWYSTSDMDGRTAIVTQGAVMAHRVGMIVVNSAGNTGTSQWHIISAPADADSILAIGAVDADGLIAPFSGRGPTADGRVKPDVCAQGVLTAHVETDGLVHYGNGTSFSSPLTAGFVACLWQANPNATNYEIMNWVRQSAHMYSYPDSDYGYGIPNFQFAMELAGILPESESVLYPNPTTGDLYVKVNFGVGSTYHVFDYSGRVVASGELDFPRNARIVMPSGASAGVYIVRIANGDDIYTEKILLQR